MKFDWPTLLIWGLIFGYSLIFGLIATQEHLAFETSALDLGNYNQALWNAAHGRGLALTMLPEISLNRMGLHVEPILFLLVPLYWLWPSPLLLLWVQSIALGLAAWPLYLLARKRLGSTWAALTMATAYLLLPTTESVTLFDFHAVALSPLFMLSAIYFLDQALEAQTGRGFWGWYFPLPFRQRNSEELRGTQRNKQGKQKAPDDTRFKDVSSLTKRAYTLAALFFILAMATKEDIPLHVFMVGFYVIFFLRQRRVGLPIALSGLVWAFIAFGVIIPAFRVAGEHSVYVEYFPTLGQTPLEIALSPLVRPLAVIQLLLRPANFKALGMLIIPFAGLGLMSLPIFILAAPSLAISLLSNNPLQQALETWHYAAPMLPFITLAATDGLARLNRVLSAKGQMSGAASQEGPGERQLPPSQGRGVAFLSIVLLITALIYHNLRGYSPLAQPFHWPEITAHHRLGHALSAAIPPEANLVVQAELAPHVSKRQNLSIWTGSFPEEADYIFVDIAHPKFINLDNAQGNLLAGLIHDKNFGVTTMQDGYLILKRGGERVPLEPSLQTFLFASPTEVALQKNSSPLAQFGSLAELVGVKPHTYRQSEPQVTLYLKALDRPDTEYFLHLYLLDKAGVVIGATVFKQPAMIWWPPQLWHPDDILKIRFNTLPWWTNDGKTNQFSYALAISRSDDPWDVEARLPVDGPNVLPDNMAHVYYFQRRANMVYSLPQGDRKTP